MHIYLYLYILNLCDIALVDKYIVIIISTVLLPSPNCTFIVIIIDLSTDMSTWIVLCIGPQHRRLVTTSGNTICCIASWVLNIWCRHIQIVGLISDPLVASCPTVASWPRLANTSEPCVVRCDRLWCKHGAAESARIPISEGGDAGRRFPGPSVDLR